MTLLSVYLVPPVLWPKYVWVACVYPCHFSTCAQPSVASGCVAVAPLEFSLESLVNPLALPVFLLLNQHWLHLNEFMSSSSSGKAASFHSLPRPCLGWSTVMTELRLQVGRKGMSHGQGRHIPALFSPKVHINKCVFFLRHKHFSLCYIPLVRFQSANKMVGFEHFVLLYTAF